MIWYVIKLLRGKYSARKMRKGHSTLWEPFNNSTAKWQSHSTAKLQIGIKSYRYDIVA